MDAPFTRYALIRSAALEIADYLPSNYEVIYREVTADRPEGGQTVIAGRDRAGWGLDTYVLPRLASGLHFGMEIDLSHPIMKVIPA